MPVNTHLLIPKALPGGRYPGTIALEITPKALVAGICEQLYVQCTGPVCIIEEVHPIPAGEVGEPPLNVILNFHVQLDAVVQVSCPLKRSLSSATGRLCQEAHLQTKCNLPIRERISCFVADVA